MRILVIALLLVNLYPVFGQEKNKVEAVLPDIISQFPNVRDFTISDSENEAYFSAQDNIGSVSVIMLANKKKNKWSKPKIASFSGEYMDLEPFLSADGLKLFFASNRPLNDSTSKAKDFDIWYVQRASKNQKWSEPINMGSPVNTDGNEFYPSLSQNNNLYFTADPKTSKGKDDIYLSTWENGAYQKPISLSDSINSAGYEFNAYIAQDESYLLFTAYNRPDGLGSGDLYISFRNDKGVWSKAQNLKDINSSKMDYCPFVDTKSKMLYFTSKRIAIDVPEKGFKSVDDFLKEVNKYKNGLSRIFKVSIKDLIAN
jgi:hypothetical protein